MNLSLTPTIQETRLVKELITASCKALPIGVRANGSIEYNHDRVTNGLIATIHSYLIKGTHRRTHTISLKTPATWWQHFKETKFPAWLLKRFPVVYTERPFTYESETRICPHGDFAWGDRSHIDFIRYEDVTELGDVRLPAEWWARFNDAMLAFDSTLWGHDLTVSVFEVIARARVAEKEVERLKSDLESSRKTTKMWYEAAHKNREEK